MKYTFDLKKLIKLFTVSFLALAVSVMLVPMSVWAENNGGGTQSPSGEYAAGTSNSEYNTTNYVQTGNGWFTPTCTHGQQVVICLPLVNMSPYNLRDVIVCPVLSGQDADWPFDISQANYTIPVGSLVGSNSEPDIGKRTQNVFWTFDVRDDVLNGYYKLDFKILYTDELCYQGVSNVSVYVDCVGKDGAGNKNSNEEIETSTPRIIITGFETIPADVQAGQDFDLIIHLKNTSTETAVNNLQIDLTATESGKDANNVYATFLPTKGSNTAYFSAIPKGGTADINMSFNAKSDLEQRPYVMKLAMKYENDKNKAYEGEGSISIPVKQQSRFELSTIQASPNTINVGYDSDIIFSIYNTGKTTLYNVKAEFIADSLAPASAFVGNLNSGATGNIDCLVTGANVTMDDGKVIVRISYEDESGNPFSEDFETNILVSSLDGGLDMDAGFVDYDEGAMIEVEKDSKIPKWLIPVIIGLLAVAGIMVAAIVVTKKKKLSKDNELSIEDLDD